MMRGIDWNQAFVGRISDSVIRHIGAAFGEGASVPADYAIANPPYGPNKRREAGE
ncbi:hypothetical protein JCM17961_18000 [Endothiovibrio diazotrophicus]